MGFGGGAFQAARIAIDGVTIITAANGQIEASGAFTTGLLNITPTSTVPTIATNGYAIWASTAASNLIFKPQSNALGFLFEDASANPLIQFNPVDDTLAMFVKIKTFLNIATAGACGIMPIYAEGITGTVTGSQASVVTYTPPATAGRYIISGCIDNTSSTNTGTTAFNVAYTNSNGTAITQQLAVLTATGTTAATATGASKSFQVVSCEIAIDNSATNIVISTTVAGSVSYKASGGIRQIG